MTEPVVIPVQGTRTSSDEMKTENKEINQILSEMNDDLRNVCDRIQTIFNRDSECALRNRYDLGKIVKEVYDNEERKYGAKSIDRLSKVLNRNPSLLYDAKKFVELYSEEKLEELLAARNSNNQPLTWSHIEALIHVPEESVREAMLVETLNESLSPRDLEKRIQKHYGGKRSNSTGRPIEKPPSFIGYLDSIIDTGDIVVKRCDTVWCGGDKTMVDAAQELKELDEALFDKIQDALDKLGDVTFSAEETARKLNELRDQLSIKFVESNQQSALAAGLDDVINAETDGPVTDDDFDDDDIDEEELTMANTTQRRPATATTQKQPARKTQKQKQPVKKK